MFKIYSGWSILWTYIDATIHFVEGSWLMRLTPKIFLLPLYVIDKSKEVAANPNFILSKQDILDFEASIWTNCQGALLPSAVIGQNVGQIKMRNLDENGVQQSPG